MQRFRVPEVQLSSRNTRFLWKTRAQQFLRWAIVWPQYTWAEKWGRLLCPLSLGELGPHLTQCRLGRAYLSVLYVMLAYCGQTVGWIKMPLGVEVGLGPRDIVLYGDPKEACATWRGHWRYLANTIEPSMFGWAKWIGGDAALCQISLTNSCCWLSSFQQKCYTSQTFESRPTPKTAVSKLYYRVAKKPKAAMFDCPHLTMPELICWILDTLQRYFVLSTFINYIVLF